MSLVYKKGHLIKCSFNTICICIFFTFSVRQEIAYQGASQSRDFQKGLQSTAEVRCVPVTLIKYLNQLLVVDTHYGLLQIHESDWFSQN